METTTEHGCSWGAVKPTAAAYCLTIAVVAGACVARRLLDPVLGDHVPYITFFLAVVVAAWVGGLRAAGLATVLSFGLALYFFVPPRFSLIIPSGPYFVSLLMYFMVCLSIAGFGEAMHVARRRAERDRARLSAERDQVAATLESITDAFTRFDRDWRIVYVNAHAERLTGRLRSELVGQSYWDAFPAAHGTIVETEYRRAVAEQVTVEFEHYFAPLSRWFAIKGDPTPDGGLTVYFRDITDRKRAEAEARLTNQRFDLAVKCSQVVLWQQDTELRFTWLHNPAPGIDGTNAVGKSDEDLLERAEDAAVIVGIKREVIRSGVSLRREFCPQIQGVSHCFEVLIEPLRDAAGVVIGITGAAIDITERKKIEKELRRLAAELSEADRKKDEFIATLAHELRNPLAPIRHSLQIMKLSGNNPEAVKNSGGIMERQVEQMTHLIDDLMDLSRIRGGKIVLQKARLKVSDVIQNALDTSRPLIEERGHELVVDMPTEPLYVDGDSTRLAQVFGNLLNNAAKYTKSGGRIRVTVERQGSDVVVAVVDNGLGIPVHMLDRVFDMFAQVDHSLEKSQGGLGIGLNIVKKLVEMHEGSIMAESNGPGTGSQFVVRLPVVLTAASEKPEHDCDQTVTPAGRRRILVVDDNMEGARSLAMMLKIMGNETQTAYDGLEAVEAAAKFLPEIVLLDIGLPKLNGYEVAHKIREQPWGHDMVLVALTGWGQEEDRQKSKDAGFDAHLVKPVELSVLMKLLADLETRTKANSSTFVSKPDHAAELSEDPAK